MGSKLYLFKVQIMHGKELRCLNTKGNYGKVTNTEIKRSIVSKSVMIIIFVEFIDQLIDYPINHDSLSFYCLWILFVCVEVLRPSQPNGVMSSAVSLPNHMFTGQA